MVELLLFVAGGVFGFVAGLAYARHLLKEAAEKADRALGYLNRANLLYDKIMERE